MSIYTKESVIESYPAYDILLREEDPNYKAVNITSHDILGLKHPRGFYRTYSPGSVVSYALRYNECPIEAIKDANERGHQLHWINGRASVISDSPRARERLVLVHIGMKVRFEGLIATIEADHNNNLKFVPVKK